MPPRQRAQFRAVCWGWCELASAPELWRHLELESTDEAAAAFCAAPYLRCALSVTLLYPPASLTNVGLRRLVEHCDGLQKLDLSWSKITDEGVRVIAAHCRDVRWLILRGSLVTDAGLDSLDFPRLERLSLADLLGVTDAGMKHVVRRCSAGLAALDIGWTSVRCDGVRALLAGCVHLHTLGLWGCRVGDNVVPVLLGSSTLREVNLSSTAVSARGVEALVCAAGPDPLLGSGGTTRDGRSCSLLSVIYVGVCNACLPDHVYAAASQRGITIVVYK
eukprot:TRINITY_DN16959_c0_g1_i1.p1 TRINITY_DN16959_c0_g1~~TRINITY_DN16959_c0_g1_i1.p1  ORF type:complete len:295 (-),score=66.76 TRINITY_DN16959_c0_g1_i1:37-864(-)